MYLESFDQRRPIPKSHGCQGCFFFFFFNHIFDPHMLSDGVYLNELFLYLCPLNPKKKHSNFMYFDSFWVAFFFFAFVIIISLLGGFVWDEYNFLLISCPVNLFTILASNGMLYFDYRLCPSFLIFCLNLRRKKLFCIVIYLLSFFYLIFV